MQSSFFEYINLEYISELIPLSSTLSLNANTHANIFVVLQI